MTKRQKLTEGWETLGIMLKPGNLSDKAVKMGFEMLCEHFQNIRMSETDIDNLIAHLIKTHSFFPTVAEVVSAWEAVRPHRTMSEPTPDPATLPEKERPLR